METLLPSGVDSTGGPVGWVNFYLKLLGEKIPKVKIFTTFFIPEFKLNPKRMWRWSRCELLFDNDFWLFPVFENNHWTLVVFDKLAPSVKHYNSLGGPDQKLIENLRLYMHEEMGRRGDETKLQGFSTADPRPPQQSNTRDCGVFVCEFAKRLIQKHPLEPMGDVNYIRKRIAMEILHKTIF